MPYTGPDDDKLPDHVKAMPEGQRTRWVTVWNDVYARCTLEGGGECEGRAFAAANGVVEESEASMTATNLIYVELAVETPLLDEGKAFDGLAPGTFVDRLGRDLSVTWDDLKKVAANTRAAIEATRGESGAVRGLPIDATNHDQGDAAGWIIGVELDEDRKVLRFIPKWTELGRELLSQGLRGFFSASIDLAKKVVLGGTLTNWPATRDHETSNILLRPIELASDLSLYATARRDNASWAAGFREAFLSAFRTLLPNQPEPDDLPPGTGPEAQPEDSITHPEGEDTHGEGETDMPVDFDELTEEQRTALAQEAEKRFLKRLGVVDADDPDAALEELRDKLQIDAFGELAGVADARQAMEAQMEAALRAELERMQSRSAQMLASMMANIKKEQEIADLSQRLTQGTEDVPHGLPVTQEEIERTLGNLDEGDRQAVTAILTKTWKAGFVEFEEKGHGRRVKGSRALPDDIAADLRAGNLTVDDLRNPILAAGLDGDVEDYDLSEFDGKDK